jgi:GTPase Era involved in 16S rRNA processing
MSDPYSPIEKLAHLVNLARRRAVEKELPKGRQEQLETLAYRLQKIRSFEQGKGNKKRVGVFGAPNRGKSTLLNALLGEDLMPTSPIPFSTTTIEIESDHSIIGWSLIINHESGYIEEKKCDSAPEMNKLLVHYGARSSAKPAQRLRIKGAFPNCKILNEGGILLDTPGAEVAFEPDEQLADEAQKALEALKTTHLVLFCIRADQIGSRSDSELYEKHIRPLSPVHVVTMKDRWDQDIGGLVDTVLSNYGLAQSDPVLVSAKQALDPSTLETSGIPDFEQTVLTELSRLTPEHGLLTNLMSFELAAEDFPEIRPERIHFLNLYHAIEELDNDWGREALSRMNIKHEFWNK